MDGERHSLKLVPTRGVNGGWDQGWSDQVVDEAVRCYEDTGSGAKARDLLLKNGYTDGKGQPPSVRTIQRWVAKATKDRAIDIQRDAIQARRARVQEKAWDKAEEIADMPLPEGGKDLYGYAGAFKTFYDVGSKAAAEGGEGDTVEDWQVAIIGRRTIRSHSGLVYRDGEYIEAEYTE